MRIRDKQLDHIEVFDETGRFILSISDNEIIGLNNCKVMFCEEDKMFTGVEAEEFYPY